MGTFHIKQCWSYMLRNTKEISVVYTCKAVHNIIHKGIYIMQRSLIFCVLYTMGSVAIYGQSPTANQGWLIEPLTSPHLTAPSLSTENICSGCSDPRFRGWHRGAQNNTIEHRLKPFHKAIPFWTRGSADTTPPAWTAIRPAMRYTTLRMQLQPVFCCSSLNALDPDSER